jgi:secreted trypsin-like serine protease
LDKSIDDLEVKTEINDSSTSKRQPLKIEKIKIHEKYDPKDKRFNYNIALLKLKKEIVSSEFTKFACLPSRSMTSINKGEVAGWATDAKDAGLVGSRKFSGLKIEDDEHSTILRVFRSILKIPENTFLTSNSTGFCDGIAGSGMYIKVHNLYFLRGIVSKTLFNDGNDCANPDNPVVHTDILKYLDFIEEFEKE